MNVIITYDISIKHQQLKQAMFNLGYRDQISGVTCKIIYLPNTTLFHSKKTPEEALNDVKSECQRLQIKLERCVSTNWGPKWIAICGETFN